jgi:hypothetical protein
MIKAAIKIRARSAVTCAAASVAALGLVLGGSLAAHAAEFGEGSFDAWEVEVDDGQLVIGTHNHDDPSYNWDPASDYFVTDADGEIHSDGALEVGFSTEEVYEAGFTGSVTFTITAATFDDGTDVVPATDVTVTGETGTLFNLAGYDYAQSFGSDNQHEHWDWYFGDGSGAYTITVVASASDTYSPSDPYTVTFVVP